MMNLPCPGAKQTIQDPKPDMADTWIDPIGVIPRFQE